MRPFLTALPLALLLVATVTGAFVGGWRVMSEKDMSSESFQTALRAATAAYNARFAAGDNGVASVQGVTEAMSQVVAGVKYKFKATMSSCGDAEDCDAPVRSCEFQVVHRAWVRDEPTKVLKISC